VPDMVDESHEACADLLQERLASSFICLYIL